MGVLKPFAFGAVAAAGFAATKFVCCQLSQQWDESAVCSGQGTLAAARSTSPRISRIQFQADTVDGFVV